MRSDERVDELFDEMMELFASRDRIQELYIQLAIRLEALEQNNRKEA